MEVPLQVSWQTQQVSFLTYKQGIMTHSPALGAVLEKGLKTTQTKALLLTWYSVPHW